MKTFFCFLFVTSIAVPATAQLRLTSDLAVSRFEQQVKTEIGGARGERLVEETFLGLNVQGSYLLWDYFAAGVFVRGDVGSRSAGTFEAFDENGAPTIVDETGGAFAELWLGPVVSAHYKTLFAQVGYGALGLRCDSARDDLPAEGGGTGAFRTSPTIAWLVAIGGGIPVLETLQIHLRLEYRVRYYTRRSGDVLENDVAHGTQNLTPFFGIVWTP